VAGIVEVRQSLIRRRRRLIDLGRTFHLPGFVRGLLIKDLDEVVEAGLLLQEVA
jgi:hypothetical protein